MPEFFSKWLQRELLTHPGVILSAVLFLVFGGGFASKSVFVMADDYRVFQQATKEELNGVKTKLEVINKSLCDLEYMSNKNALEQKVSVAEAEVFQLSRMEKSNEATRLDLERLDKQRTELNRLQRELQVLQRNGC